jgi:hypothetical protein
VSKPKTPAITPATWGSIAFGIAGVVSQFIPLTDEAKEGVREVVITIATLLAAHDLGVRAARSKWLGELLFRDHDDDPKTPPVATSRLYALMGGLFGWAVGATVALIVVLVF